MHRIFLSFHYDQTGQALADDVGTLVKSHGLILSTGENLAGRDLTDGIREKIDECDAVICLLTKRDQGQDNQWVITERVYALAREKPVLTVVQKDLNPPGGMFGRNEYVPHDPDNLAGTILNLSIRIGELRRRVGRFVKVIIEPDDAAALARNEQMAKTQYRCLDDHGNPTGWKDASTARTQGGVIAHLAGVTDGALVQLKLQGNGQTWESPYVAQSLRIELEKLQ